MNFARLFRLMTYFLRCTLLYFAIYYRCSTQNRPLLTVGYCYSFVVCANSCDCFNRNSRAMNGNNVKPIEGFKQNIDVWFHRVVLVHSLARLLVCSFKISVISILALKTKKFKWKWQKMTIKHVKGFDWDADALKVRRRNSRNQD